MPPRKKQSEDGSVPPSGYTQTTYMRVLFKGNTKEGTCILTHGQALTGGEWELEETPVDITWIKYQGCSQELREVRGSLEVVELFINKQNTKARVFLRKVYNSNKLGRVTTIKVTK